jgi:hypothetical protein
MNTQQDDQIALLEGYVLAPNKEAFLKTLVPNSDNHNLMLTIHELSHKQGASLSGEAAEVIKKWLENNPRKGTDQHIALERYLLHKIEAEKNGSKTKELIQTFDKLTDFSMNQLKNYNKPVIFAAGDEFKEDSENKMSTDLSPENCPNVFLKELTKKIYEQPALINSLVTESVIYHIDLEKLAKKEAKIVSTALDKISNFANLIVESVKNRI